MLRPLFYAHRPQWGVKRIAITGGIAEGKSTILGHLRDLGYDAISSDDVAREVFEEPDVQDKLRKIADLRDQVDRTALRAAIAANPAVRREVNALMHARVLVRIRASSAPIVEVPLLIETCLQGDFDRVWVATCGPAEQLRRLTARLSSEDEARRLISTQLASSVKCSFADVIIRTNQEEHHVVAFVSQTVRAEIG